MRPSQTNEGDTSSWLEKAFEDLESARILFRSDRETQRHQVLFFCQQGVEKVMKAFLVWNKIKFPWTHDLEKIGGQCCEIDPSLKHPIGQIIYLSDYAWEFRYPGEDPEPTKPEANEGITKAENFMALILEKLPKETHPKATNNPCGFCERFWLTRMLLSVFKKFFSRV